MIRIEFDDRQRRRWITFRNSAAALAVLAELQDQSLQSRIMSNDERRLDLVRKRMYEINQGRTVSDLDRLLEPDVPI